MNYFLTGWFNDFLDKFYLPSWQVFLSVILVFSISGNVTLAIMRYRLGEKGRIDVRDLLNQTKMVEYCHFLLLIDCPNLRLDRAA